MDDENKILHDIAELKGRLDEISAQQKNKKKKSFFELLTDISPLISGILITAAATVATIIYNYRESQLNQLTLLNQCRQSLSSKDNAERAFAYKLFKELGKEDWALTLISARGDSAGLITLEEIKTGKANKLIAQKAGNLAEQLMRGTSRSLLSMNDMPKNFKYMPIISPGNQKAETSEGWAYIGYWIKNEKQWETRYFDFMQYQNPDPLTLLKIENITVRKITGDLNIRESMPSPDGTFHDVIDVLKPGKAVKILDIKEWQSSGYIWAKINYKKDIK
jgi:hypothetical protein